MGTIQEDKEEQDNKTGEGAGLIVSISHLDTTVEICSPVYCWDI